MTTGKNVTLYVTNEDHQVVQRAMKLLAFYEDKSLSKLVVEHCRAIVAKYDGIEGKTP